MTKMLYLSDSYLHEFEAEVIEANGLHIVLDKTAFYPTSGGQPHDTGTITTNNTIYNVVSVGKTGENISHEVDKPGLKAGYKVRCAINWERRYRLMRMHTAAHLLIQMFHREKGALSTGGHLGEDKSRLDMAIENFGREQLPEYEKKINEVISKNLPISFYTLPVEEAQKDKNLFKLAKHFDESIKQVRIVNIGDYDVQADGGTHVKSTKEIGQVKFAGFENRGKSNKRIYYTIE